MNVSLAYRLEYVAFRAVGTLLGALPVETASAWSGHVWRVIAPLLKRHRRAVRALARAFPEKSAAECERIACDMWECLGRTFAEFFHLDSIFDSDRIDIEDAARTLAALPAGAIICAAHQGNWEIATMSLIKAGAAPAGVYQSIKNPLVDARVKTIRARFYPSGLFRKDPSIARPILRLVREGGYFAMLADLRDKNGVAVPFFGAPAPSTAFPAFLSRQSGAPIFVGRILRLPGVRFRMRLDPIAAPPAGDREAAIAATTAAIQSAFERSIRDKPAQWMWAHRRWG